MKDFKNLVGLGVEFRNVNGAIGYARLEAVYERDGIDGAIPFCVFITAFGAREYVDVRDIADMRLAVWDRSLAVNP